MTTALATGGLLVIAITVCVCLWPPPASRATTALLALGIVVTVTVLTLALAVVIIAVTLVGGILWGAGLPIPQWPKVAIERARTQLLRSFRDGA
jgi:hypothetical protein